MLQPELAVSNATSSQSGAKTYEFEVSSAADFTAIVVSADNVTEGGDGRTSWTVSRPLQGTTRYWWHARVKQGTDTGPWSTPTRFRSRIEGYNRPGELFDPLINGTTVGRGINVTFPPGQGVRLESLGSRVTYTLPQALPEGEFSVLATGLNSDSAGDSTKLFSMQQGSPDIRQNPYRATIEKRDHGTVTFRFIGGNVNAKYADGERMDLQFNPSALYFGVSWGNGFARLVLEAARMPRGYPGRQLQRHLSPNPHIAPSEPPWASGIDHASVPGAVISYAGFQQTRPSGLGRQSRRDDWTLLHCFVLPEVPRVPALRSSRPLALSDRAGAFCSFTCPKPCVTRGLWIPMPAR